MCDAPFVPDISTSTDTSYFVDRYTNDKDLTTSFRTSLTRSGYPNKERGLMSGEWDEEESASELDSDGLFTGFDYSNIFNLKEMNDEQLGFKTKEFQGEGILDSESVSESSGDIMEEVWDSNGDSIEGHTLTQQNISNTNKRVIVMDDKDLQISVPASTTLNTQLGGFSPSSDSEEVFSSVTHSILPPSDHRDKDIYSIPSTDLPELSNTLNSGTGQSNLFHGSDMIVPEEYREDFCFDDDDEDESLVSVKPLNTTQTFVYSSSEDSQNDMSFFDVKVEEEGDYVNYTVDFENFSN